jgi:hypothetical protein
MIEAALADLHGCCDPLKIDVAVLGKAATLAGMSFNKGTPYTVGQELEVLADVLARHGIVSGELGQWRSSLKAPRNMGYTVGSEGDKARREKLPSLAALEALADVFCRDLDPSDDRCHRDIYTTSVTALLLCAPSRGQEVHRLPVSLVFEATDRFGQQQMGLRLHASKGFGAYVKWVWSEMVPVAQKALERLTAITEAGRTLARHLEDPQTREHFYRHADCPAVGEDEPLTAEQACLALGLSTTHPWSALRAAGLSGTRGANTLRSLWTDWALPRHREAHPHFPWVSARDKALGKRGGLKYSEALLCMRANQMNLEHGTSPVRLWMPTLGNAYSRDIGLSIGEEIVNIFDRYGYTDSDGHPLKLKSHQIRHLLNTEAQRMGLSDEQIAHWSGRKDVRQNAIYDHRLEQERVDQARPWVAGHESLPGPWIPVGEDGSQTRQDGHWRIDVGPKPRSCSDLEDIQPRLSGLKTEYGECHHDWALAPCEGFVECLDCSEHRCIKGGDADAQEKLQRLQALHRQVLTEVAKAKAAVATGDWGTEEWLDLQQRYAAKLEQLIGLLQNPQVSDGSVIRLANGEHPSHLHRALRGLAIKALEDGTAPEHVMKHMLQSLDDALNPVQTISVQAPRRLAGPGSTPQA